MLVQHFASVLEQLMYASEQNSFASESSLNLLVALKSNSFEDTLRHVIREELSAYASHIFCFLYVQLTIAALCYIL
jgi:hypothetical protein